MDEAMTSTVHQAIDSKDNVLQAVDSLDTKVDAINIRVKDLVKKLETTEKVTPEAMADM